VPLTGLDGAHGTVYHANEMDNERMTDVKPTYDDLLARVALLEQQRDQETAAAAATEALRLSESQLRAIIERSPMSMAVVGMDGTIEYFNRRASRPSAISTRTSP
jgi:PAS domain-containing protein